MGWGTETTQISIIHQVHRGYRGHIRSGSRNWEFRRGKLRYRSWGTYQNVRVGQIASIKACSCDCQPQARSSSRLGCLGEHRKFLCGVWGPRNHDFEHFMPFWDPININYVAVTLDPLIFFLQRTQVNTHCLIQVYQLQLSDMTYLTNLLFSLNFPPWTKATWHIFTPVI